MAIEVLYHGTDGDSVLGIIATGSMLAANGKLFFSKYRWEDSLMHGGDRRRKASFVIKVSVSVPHGAVTYLDSTPGVPLTYVIETILPLRAEVLELFVREPTADGFDGHRIVGSQAIRSYLQSTR